MKLNKWMKAGIGLSVAALWSCPTLAALTATENFGIEIKGTGQSEDDRDLSTRQGGNLNGVGIDLRPWAYGERGKWAGYVMGQVVAASATIQTDPLDQTSDQGNDISGINHNSARDGNDVYFAMREFWVSYTGLFTPYPGENTKLGRQRLRNDDGEWQDNNIEALTWNLDTTLLKTHLGVAQRFSDYRTDYSKLSPTDKDRLHAFGDAYYQWMPGQWIGARAHYVHDSGNLANAGTVVDDLDKRDNSKLTWLGLDANSDAYNYRNTNQINYWANSTFMHGSQNTNRDYTVDGGTSDSTDGSGRSIAAPKSNRDLSGWGSDLGIRLRLDPQWQVGGAYSRASKNYQQNGLQSNRSTWTGTRSRISRFGEAYNAQMGNTEVGSLFASWQLQDEYDASLIYHKFRRLDNTSGIGGSNIDAVTDATSGDVDTATTLPLQTGGSNDLGQEMDLVVTKYFKKGLLPAALSQSFDEPSALIRLRAGVFKPGDAYGNQVDSYMHRAIVDVIWRY